jgi:hypothetical protein
MPLLRVSWERTLFGALYYTRRSSLFHHTLARHHVSELPFVYGELFYASAPNELGSFRYSYNPVTQVTRSRIVLWTGHEEVLECGLDARRNMASFRYTLQQGDKALSWACIPASLKTALAAKSDAHILLADVGGGKNVV